MHPVTGARWSLSARTAGELAELVARAHRIGHDFRAGKLTSEEAIGECAFVQTGKVPRVRVLTFGEAWRAYEPTLVHPHVKSKAASVWKHHLVELDGELVVTFNDARLEALVRRWTEKGLAPKTIRSTLWAFFSAAIRHARRSRRIERLPWETFQPPRAIVRRRPAAATKIEELAAIVAVARRDDEIEETRGKLGDLARRVLVLALCGMRNGEGAGLGWDAVDFDGNTVTVAYQAIDQWQRHYPKKKRPDIPVKNPQLSRPLVQQLHPDARDALLEQREALRARGWYRHDGPVFPTTGGAWRKNANCIYPEDAKALAKRAGVPNAARWVTHSLRHSNASLELAGGAAPRAVQQRLGHSSLRMLDQYAHGGEGAPSAIPRLDLALRRDAGKPSDEEDPP